MQAIKRVAHTLKGTAGSIEAISRITSEVESLRLELEKTRPKLEGLGSLAGLSGS